MVLTSKKKVEFIICKSVFDPDMMRKWVALIAVIQPPDIPFGNVAVDLFQPKVARYSIVEPTDAGRYPPATTKSPFPAKVGKDVHIP